MLSLDVMRLDRKALHVDELGANKVIYDSIKTWQHEVIGADATVAWLWRYPDFVNHEALLAFDCPRCGCVCVETERAFKPVSWRVRTISYHCIRSGFPSESPPDCWIGYVGVQVPDNVFVQLLGPPLMASPNHEYTLAQYRGD